MSSKRHPVVFAAMFVGATTFIVAGLMFGPWRDLSRTQGGPITPGVVEAGQDRSGLRHYMGRGKIALDAKVSTADSRGEVFLWEILVSGKTGPGRHVHYDQDEWFYVLEGEYVAEVGEQRFFLKPGDSILLPRGVPHAYAHLSEGNGKMLGAVLPAGTFEQFLEDFRQAGIKPTPGQTQELFKKHGLKEIGPPIDVANITRDELERPDEAREPTLE